MPGRGCLDIVEVTSSMVSPLRTKTAPLACSATRPVSKLMERSPMRCSMILGSGVIGLLARPPRGLSGSGTGGNGAGLLRRSHQSLMPSQCRGGDGPYLVVEAHLPPSGGGRAAQRGTGSGRYRDVRDSPADGGVDRPAATVQGACDGPWDASSGAPSNTERALSSGPPAPLASRCRSRGCGVFR